MNRPTTCLCQNWELPQKNDWKIRVDLKIGIELLKKFNLTGTPSRTFLAKNHIFVQYKNEEGKNCIIAVCRTFYLLTAIVIDDTAYAADQRLVEYLRIIQNHCLIRKKLLV